MHKIKTGAGPAAFHTTFKIPSYSYPKHLSSINYSKQKTKLHKSRFQISIWRHVTEGYLKAQKTHYSDCREAHPWWVPHWIKFPIFNFLECWKQHFREKITKYFHCKEGVIRSSITSN